MGRKLPKMSEIQYSHVELIHLDEFPEMLIRNKVRSLNDCRFQCEDEPTARSLSHNSSTPHIPTV